MYSDYSECEEVDSCYDDYYPDLGSLTIDDILVQDDPPKDLYLKATGSYCIFDLFEESYMLKLLF